MERSTLTQQIDRGVERLLMLPGKSLYASIRLVLMLVLACGAAFMLTACGSDAPTAAPARPTATVEAVRPHPTRPPRPTPTQLVVFDTETPTPSGSGFFDDTPTPSDNGGFFNNTPTPADNTTEYTVYKPTGGDWSLEYPSDWLVKVNEPNYQFSNAPGDAFIQETYSLLDSASTNDDMVKVASEQFQANFVNYIESDQVKQNDGSYRIDFKFDVSDDTGANTTQWDAQAFIETRRQHLYMLMLATTQDAYLAGTYDDIISHVIDSYTVPSE